MEWWFVLVIMALAFCFFLALGVPIALSFVAANLLVLYFFGGGTRFFDLLSTGMFDSVNSFVLVAVPLFIMMGEVLFRCRFMLLVTDAFEALFGKVPGRVGLLTVSTGTALGALSGAPIATAATLGATLVPEMVRQGYARWLAYGSAVGGGALAVLIPPSALAILVAFLGQISPSKVLIGSAMPGFVTAALFAVFVVGICKIRPQLAPDLTGARRMRFTARVVSVVKALPLAWIIFLVTVVIFLGVATPTEAAALGAAGAFLLAMLYGRLTWAIATEALVATVKTTSMIFLIIAGSKTFSQVLSLTGAGPKLVQTVVGLPLPPLGVVAVMMLSVLLFGCFIDSISLSMITIPIYMPTVIALGYDPIWFGVLIVICLGIAGITPPVGMVLYALKGVYPAASMGDIWRGAAPFFAIQTVVLVLAMLFPSLALWLPGFMS
jgi:tripartite ATP-independent transporter DctM subunit